MKNRIASIFSLSLVLALAIVGVACGDFFVSGDAMDHINVTPVSVFLKVGETKQFTATGVTVNGDSSDISSSATWTSSSTGVATVSNAGLATAVAAGNSTISAASGGATGTASVIVNNNALNTTLNVTATSTSVAVGQTLQLKCTATFADSSTQDITTQAAWSSSATNIATVSSTGLVTGVAAGSATITATVNTATGTATGTLNITVTQF